jgi:hypothetical protein
MVKVLPFWYSESTEMALSIINDAASWRTQTNDENEKGSLAVARAEAVKDR